MVGVTRSVLHVAFFVGCVTYKEQFVKQIVVTDRLRWKCRATTNARAQYLNVGDVDCQTQYCKLGVIERVEASSTSWYYKGPLDSTKATIDSPWRPCSCGMVIASWAWPLKANKSWRQAAPAIRKRHLRGIQTLKPQRLGTVPDFEGGSRLVSTDPDWGTAVLDTSCGSVP